MRYEEGDIVTFYFVILEDEDGKKRIQGWSKDKNIVKAYMEFHNCKGMTMKAMTGKIEDLYKITEENIHDEIEVFNINTRNPNKKRREVKTIAVPATTTEIHFVGDECDTYMSTRIPYTLLNEAIPFMKDKYRKILHDLFLDDVCNAVCTNRISKRLDSIGLDQLLVFIKSLPDLFGK